MIGNFEEHLARDFFENSVLASSSPLPEADWKKVHEVHNVIENSVLATSHQFVEADWRKMYEVHNIVIQQKSSSMH